MIVNEGMICVLCNCPMHIQTKPQMIFDLEKQELKGLAHSNCAQKAKLGWYASTSIKWGEKTPSQQQIEFGCKIAKIMLAMREFGGETDQFYVKMLLHECLWKTTTLEECQAQQRFKTLLDWWVNGSKIVTAEKAERIQKLLEKKIQEASA